MDIYVCVCGYIYIIYIYIIFDLFFFFDLFYFERGNDLSSLE